MKIKKRDELKMFSSQKFFRFALLCMRHSSSLLHSRLLMTIISFFAAMNDSSSAIVPLSVLAQMGSQVARREECDGK